jgi:putative ABC transport system permease protein
VLGGKRGRTQGALVVAEFALAITLLAGAGLAIHSFWKLTSIDLGFRADHVLTAYLGTPKSEHPPLDKIKADAQHLMDRLRAVPGVQSVSLTTDLPLEGNDSYSFRISGKPVAEGNEPIAAFASVTLGYFETFGVRLLHGRLLSDSDAAGSTQVAMVSEGFVRRFLPDVDPLAEKIVFAAPVPYQKTGPPSEWQIVGVFRDVQNSEHLTDEMNPEVYLSFWQAPWPSVGLGVRTALDPALMIKNVRGAVLAAQPTRTISHIDVLQQKIDNEFKGDRFGMVLFGGFSGLALLLAAIGVYGIAAFAIAQRQHEIGLRMALGAQRDQVVRLILASAIKLAFLGICVGLGGVYLVGHLMRSTLYGIQTIDSVSFMVASLLLVTAATVASYIPARRAAKVDPMVALRNQ